MVWLGAVRLDRPRWSLRVVFAEKPWMCAGQEVWLHGVLVVKGDTVVEVGLRREEESIDGVAKEVV